MLLLLEASEAVAEERWELRYLAEEEEEEELQAAHHCQEPEVVVEGQKASPSLEPPGEMSVPRWQVPDWQVLTTLDHRQKEDEGVPLCQTKWRQAEPHCHRRGGHRPSPLHPRPCQSPSPQNQPSFERQVARVVGVAVASCDGKDL